MIVGDCRISAIIEATCSYFTVLLIGLTRRLSLVQITEASMTLGMVVNCNVSLSSCQISATPKVCATCCWMECVVLVSLSAPLLLISTAAAFCDKMKGSSLGWAPRRPTSVVAFLGYQSKRHLGYECINPVSIAFEIIGSWLFLTPFIGRRVTLYTLPWAAVRGKWGPRSVVPHLFESWVG